MYALGVLSSSSMIVSINQSINQSINRKSANLKPPIPYMLSLSLFRSAASYREKSGLPTQKTKASTDCILNKIPATNKLDQAENFPHPRCCMSLSSSLPGHMILPFQSAWMCATAVMSHMMTRKIVRALQMPLIPGLLKAEPTWMAARVRPALGKTNWWKKC
jgi:hypothetical protein